MNILLSLFQTSHPKKIKLKHGFPRSAICGGDLTSYIARKNKNREREKVKIRDSAAAHIKTSVSAAANRNIVTVRVTRMSMKIQS